MGEMGWRKRMKEEFDIKKLFRKENVLDKGHVELIDGMITHPMLKVVNSARVSFLKEAKELTERDAKLIKFLIDHEHFSTLRHSYFSFRIKAPLCVFRQWWKYQIGSQWLENENVGSIEIQDTSWNEACLTSDTMVYTEKVSSNKRNIIRYSLEKLNKFWQNGKQDVVKSLLVRSLNEEKNIIELNTIKDVIDRGVQDVYEISLSSGKTIKCTKSHRIFTSLGWKTMQDSLNLIETNNILAFNSQAEWATNGKQIVGTGDYRNQHWLSVQLLNGLTYKQIAENVGCSQATIKKWVRKNGLFGNDFKFRSKNIPWNKGLSYKQVKYNGYTKEHLEAIKKARSGEKSNFWRGGTTTERRKITKWTTEQAKVVHEKSGYRCQNCNYFGKKLDAHHIIPVTMDIALAYDVNNLISICKKCHVQIHKTKKMELEFAKKFTTLNEKSFNEYVSSPRIRHRAKANLAPKFEKVISVKYLGKQKCYDLEMEGKNKNFVANGIIVHNSGRYVEFEPEFYVPEVIRIQSKDNKQGSYGKLEALESGVDPVDFFRNVCDFQYQNYKAIVAAGGAKEQARMLLPQNIYSECIWTCSLQTILFFLHQRLKEDAQWEIREYAKAIKHLIQPILIEDIIK